MVAWGFLTLFLKGNKSADLRSYFIFNQREHHHHKSATTGVRAHYVRRSASPQRRPRQRPRTTTKARSSDGVRGHDSSIPANARSLRRWTGPRTRRRDQDGREQGSSASATGGRRRPLRRRPRSVGRSRPSSLPRRDRRSFARRRTDDGPPDRLTVDADLNADLDARLFEIELKLRERPRGTLRRRRERDASNR